MRRQPIGPTGHEKTEASHGHDWLFRDQSDQSVNTVHSCCSHCVRIIPISFYSIVFLHEEASQLEQNTWKQLESWKRAFRPSRFENTKLKTPNMNYEVQVISDHQYFKSPWGLLAGENITVLGWSVLQKSSHINLHSANVYMNAKTDKSYIWMKQYVLFTRTRFGSRQLGHYTLFVQNI